MATPGFSAAASLYQTQIYYRTTGSGDGLDLPPRGGNRCLVGEVHCGDRCCTRGDSCCDRTCADILTDSKHCGDCDTSCPAGEICYTGDCMSCTAYCEAFNAALVAKYDQCERKCVHPHLCACERSVPMFCPSIQYCDGACAL